MYFSWQTILTLLAIVVTGNGISLIGYAFIRSNDDRRTEQMKRIRDAEEVARVKANSPHRLACPACGAAPHSPCTRIEGGTTPLEPHRERVAALKELLQAEFEASYPAYRRAHT